jgi:L-serine dehydratase
MPERGSTPPVSLLDLFKIGIGPSSSHTIGPMRAAADFRAQLAGQNVARLTATAYGSLAWTGKGHATDRALILGLAGFTPDSIDPDAADEALRQIHANHDLPLPDGTNISFDPATDVIFDRETHFERHSNAMRFTAFNAAGHALATKLCFSIGGGFIVAEGETEAPAAAATVPYPYDDAVELLRLAAAANLSIADLALTNEAARRPVPEIRAYVTKIADTMLACITRGLTQEGELGGGLHVKRRAARIFADLQSRAQANDAPPHAYMDFVSAFAMAVNEENAAGGRVVTAPTNGAAGVIPAVLRYYRDFCIGADDAGLQKFFLTAAAIGGLIKRNASISGAEVGCQGEVGSPGPLHRAQRLRRHQGHRRRLAGPPWRRHPHRLARRRHRDHAPDRPRHAEQVQGDQPRRPRRQCRNLLSTHPHFPPGKVDFTPFRHFAPGPAPPPKAKHGLQERHTDSSWPV